MPNQRSTKHRKNIEKALKKQSGEVEAGRHAREAGQTNSRSIKIFLQLPISSKPVWALMRIWRYGSRAGRTKARRAHQSTPRAPKHAALSSRAALSSLLGVKSAYLFSSVGGIRLVLPFTRALGDDSIYTQNPLDCLNHDYYNKSWRQRNLGS